MYVYGFARTSGCTFKAKDEANVKEHLVNVSRTAEASLDLVPVQTDPKKGETLDEW